MITAKFGSKSFEVSPKKILTPSGIDFSEELAFEEVETESSSGSSKTKKPPIKVKVIKPKDLSFDIKLDCRFVDVGNEIIWWEKTLKSKKAQLFCLGKYSLGYFLLTKYGVKESNTDKNGEFLSAIISLSFIEDESAMSNIQKTTSKKAAAVKASKSNSSSTSSKVRKGSTIKPKSGVRWYYTAEGAIKKSGKSGKAYQKNMTVTYTYSKSGKIVCVNPQGLGWLKVEDVTVVKY